MINPTYILPERNPIIVLVVACSSQLKFSPATIRPIIKKMSEKPNKKLIQKVPPLVVCCLLSIFA